MFRLKARNDLYSTKEIKIIMKLHDQYTSTFGKLYDIKVLTSTIATMKHVNGIKRSFRFK